MQDFVIVLVNGIGAPPLSNGRVDALCASEVPDICLHRIAWLSTGEAAELHLRVQDRIGAEGIADAVRSNLAGAPVDCLLISADGRKKKLLIADMESTVIAEECLDELAGVAGIGRQVAAITERAMRGELDFETSLRKRVRLLTGLPISALEALRDRLTLMPGAATLVATMRAHGAYTALVSGGFTVFTQPVAARLGFHVHFANGLGLAGGKLDGTVAEPVLGRAAKAERLVALASQHGLALSQTLAVGDGANDVEMVSRAGLGVAFRGKRLLTDVAGAVVRHADLTALLYLQGYRRDEFVG